MKFVIKFVKIREFVGIEGDPQPLGFIPDCQGVEGDAFFPEINPLEWEIIESDFNLKDEKHLFDYTYQTYIRK